MSLVAIAVGSLLMSMPAQGADAASRPVSLADFDGCWSGTGNAAGMDIVGKLKVSPILAGTHRLFEIETHAKGNSQDRVYTHIIVGETAEILGVLTSYFADSFGADFAASGKGTIDADGLSIEYARPRYPEVNRWAIDGSVLRWSMTTVRAPDDHIVYQTVELSRVPCPRA